MSSLNSIAGKLKRILSWRTRSFVSRDQLKTRPLDITVAFTNLNDFVTTFSELGDKAGVALLNEYYSTMTPIVRRYHGYLNQYDFDRLFFFFGEIFGENKANHSADAIRTVLEMQVALDLLNQRLMEDGKPQLRMRAGIATGKAMVGDIGSIEYCQFTAIGPAVNLARRLEKLCKQTDARNLIDTQSRDQAASSFSFRPIDLSSIEEAGSLQAFEATGHS